MGPYGIFLNVQKEIGMPGTEFHIALAANDVVRSPNSFLGCAMPTEELRHDTERYLMNTYARFPISIYRGKGCKVYDLEGREYLDFVAGIAVNILGHSHPDLIAAIQRQAQSLLHASNLYYTEPQVKVARCLVSHSFADKVFFCNSGAEANEAAIKLARLYGHQHHGPERSEIVTMLGSFHGRTLATLTATGQAKIQKGFEPLMPGFKYVPFNDLPAVEQALDARTAAVMLEPVQGEGGVHVADPAYLAALRKLCHERDVLLIFDEVQTGMGRTGTLFAYEQLGVEPDVMTLAKGLGGGMPIGACLATEKVAAAFTPGSHASTFGGNPLACAAALAVLNALLEGRLLDHCRLMGEHLSKGLCDLKERLPMVKAARGLGLLQGLELTIEGKPVVMDCLARGLLINCTVERVLRFVPPLIIAQREIDRLLDVLSQVLAKRV
jgi:acetylornithine/N-succinyldiaminopimelate aminotransferase